MASERAPSPTQVTQESQPQNTAHPEPAPQPAPQSARQSQSQAGDPFRSREGSLRQETTVNIPLPPTTPRFEAPAPFADGDSDIGAQDRDRGHGGSPQFAPSPVTRYPSEARPSMRRQVTTDTRMSHRPRSYMDPHLSGIPVIEKLAPSVEERLRDTIDEAKKRKEEYEWKAKVYGYVLNIAIGLQVLLGSLTTGLSAAATSGKSAAVQTTILGALSTIVASYLARARGSGEPENSNARAKNLDQFLREANAFVLDHRDADSRSDHGINEQIIRMRERLEVLLGNTTKGEPTRPPPTSAA